MFVEIPSIELCVAVEITTLSTLFMPFILFTLRSF